MKRLVIIVYVGFLTGCTSHWAHPVKGYLEFDHDYAFCEAVGGMAAQGMMSDKYWLMFVDVARALTAQHELQRCMERRGWTTVSVAARHGRVPNSPAASSCEIVQRERHAQTM